MQEKKPPVREQVTLRLPEDLLGELKVKAAEKDIPLNQLVVQCLQEFVREYPQT